jgi:hypothetical protein
MLYNLFIDQINKGRSSSTRGGPYRGGDVMLWNDYIFYRTYKGDYKDYITQDKLRRSSIYKDLFLIKLLRNLI